jgi:hypothetical protein
MRLVRVLVVLLFLVAAVVLAAGCTGNFGSRDETNAITSVSMTPVPSITTPYITTPPTIRYAGIADIEAYRNNQTFLRKVSDDLLMISDPAYLKTFTTPEDERNLLIKFGILIPADQAVAQFGLQNLTGRPVGDHVHVHIGFRRPIVFTNISTLITNVSYYDENQNSTEILAWIDINNLNNLAKQEEIASIRTVTPVIYE